MAWNQWRIRWSQVIQSSVRLADLDLEYVANSLKCAVMGL